MCRQCGLNNTVQVQVQVHFTEAELLMTSIPLIRLRRRRLHDLGRSRMSAISKPSGPMGTTWPDWCAHAVAIRTARYHNYPCLTLHPSLLALKPCGAHCGTRVECSTPNTGRHSIDRRVCHETIDSSPPSGIYGSRCPSWHYGMLNPSVSNCDQSVSPSPSSLSGPQLGDYHN
jgi:hypothetical protein